MSSYILVCVPCFYIPTFHDPMLYCNLTICYFGTWLHYDYWHLLWCWSLSYFVSALYIIIVIYFFNKVAGSWILVWFINKRSMGLEALLIKLLHQHNFHNFGRDPQQDASHKIWSQSSQELEIAFENGDEKNQKIAKNWSEINISSSLTCTSLIPTTHRMGPSMCNIFFFFN